MNARADQVTRLATFLSTGRPILWPGDSPDLCRARLDAAAKEANLLAKYRRTNRNTQPTRRTP